MRLRIVEGEALIANHEGRFFCGRCAGRLFNRASSYPNTTALVVTSLDPEPAIQPSVHFNLESKAPWYEILDDAPRFDGFPPEVERSLEGSDG